MSNDLRTIKQEFRDILVNKDVIAIDQDPMGIMGRLVVNVRSRNSFLNIVIVL